MKKTVKLLLAVLFVYCLMMLSSKITFGAQTANTSSPAVKAANPPAGFSHHYATVNGVKIHYVTGGKGAPLLLVHGFGQNWYMWNRLLPELSKHFTVIAPDLRGVGESGKPKGGYDKKTMAVDLHELMKKLGYSNINLAGHDIGLMVAYAYAAQFPNDVKKVALMDALLPGVEPVWSSVKAGAWWFGFFGMPQSGEIVSGKAGLFLTNFWPLVGYVKNPFTDAEKKEFIRAYSVPGGTTGAFAWFGAFPKDAEDNVKLMQTKLTMPLLAMGSQHFAAPFLADHSKLVATNVTESVIKNSGHWIVQENTAQVQKDLLDFFLNK